MAHRKVARFAMTRDSPVSLHSWIHLTFALGVASAGCLLMIVPRMAGTGSIRYSFLQWYDIILNSAFAELVNLKAVPMSMCFTLFIFLTYLAVYFLYETARKTRV